MQCWWHGSLFLWHRALYLSVSRERRTGCDAKWPDASDSGQAWPDGPWKETQNERNKKATTWNNEEHETAPSDTPDVRRHKEISHPARAMDPALMPGIVETTQTGNVPENARALNRES